MQAGLVACQFNDVVMLFDCETCQALKGKCGDSFVPESNYAEVPDYGISVSWGNFPEKVTTGDVIQTEIQTSSEPFILTYAIRNLQENTFQEIPYNGTDFQLNTIGLAPGSYELQARVAMRKMLQISVRFIFRSQLM